MKDELSLYHVPVLCAESVAWLITNPNGIYVDATMGGGGHSRAILQALGPKGHLFAFDRDADAIAQAPQDERFTFVASDFRYIGNWMEYYGVSSLDGILADLGVSSHHFDEGERGFSFRSRNAMPDMRMNGRGGITARDLLCNASEATLADLFYHYGELKDARKIASLVVQARAYCSYNTIEEFINAIDSILPKGELQQKGKLSRIFQALRIEVNGELESLKSLLLGGNNLLHPGGRMAFISYHSLEDRLVKDYFRLQRFDRDMDRGMCDPSLKVLTKKPLLPTSEEIARNSRARSAKLRVAERI